MPFAARFVSWAGGGRLAFVLLVAAVGLPRSVPADDAPLTIAGYKRSILDQRARLGVILYEYASETTCDEESRAHGLLHGYGVEEQATIAVSGKKRHATRASRSILEGGIESSQQLVSVFTGDENRRRESGTLFVQSAKADDSEISVYCSALLWPASDSELAICRERPMETAYLPYFLDEAAYRVEDARETVNGVECAVIRKLDGKRTLWIDPARGYALIRYEQLQPYPGTPRWQFDYHDLREVAPGLFLPWRIVGVTERADPKTGNPLGATSTSIVIKRMSLEPIPDSMFELEPRPGESIVDRSRGTTTEHNPPDADALDRAIAKAEREEEAMAVQNLATTYLPVAIGAVLLAIVLFLVVRRVRAG